MQRLMESQAYNENNIRIYKKLKEQYLRYYFTQRSEQYLKRIAEQNADRIEGTNTKDLYLKLKEIALDMLLNEQEIIIFSHWIDLYPDLSLESKPALDEIYMIAITLKFSLYSEQTMEHFQYSHVLNTFLRENRHEIREMHNTWIRDNSLHFTAIAKDVHKKFLTLSKHEGEQTLGDLIE